MSRLCRPSACMRRCLERAFSEPPGSLARSRIAIIPHSAIARLHLGYTTTRRDRLFLPRSCAEFWRSPELVLHEYYHLLRQWRPGHLTVPRYLMASLRHPSRLHDANRYEREAEAFVRDNLRPFVECLSEGGTRPWCT